MTTPVVDLTPAQQDVWQRQLDAEWRAVIAANVEQNRDKVAHLVATMPKPSLLNRRKEEVAHLVENLLALDLCWTSEVIYNCYPNPGWNHNRTVKVVEHQLLLGDRFLDKVERHFRLTDEHVQRFEEQGQRWANRQSQHLSRQPTRAEVNAIDRRMKEAMELRSEMGRRSGHGHRRGGSDDSDSWTSNPSSPVPNPYNGWGGGMGG